MVVRRSIGVHRSSFPPSGNRHEYVRHLGTSPNKVNSNGLEGYDAFENTNNKKKRKIPTSGSLGCHSSLSADLASISTSSGNGASSVILDDTGGAGSYYAPGNPASPVGSGISGSGRGRYGRHAGRAGSGRTPLAAHSPNAWLGGRPGTGRAPNQDHIGRFYSSPVASQT